MPSIRNVTVFLSVVVATVTLAHVLSLTAEAELASPPSRADFSVLDGNGEGKSRAGSRVSRTEIAAYSLDVTAAVKVRNADDLTLTPGIGGMCLNTAEAMSCNDYEVATSSDLLVVEVCGPGTPPGTVKVSGVVPDGITRVAIQMTDGQQRSVEVADNAYSVEVAGAPARLLGGDGTVLTEFGSSGELDPASC